MSLAIFGSLLGGLFGASSANKAAKAQQAAAERDLKFQTETRDLIFGRLDPFYRPGVTANNALAYEMGLAEAPTIGGTPAAIETFTTTTPGTTGFTRRRDGESINGTMGLSRPGATTTGYRVGGQTFATLQEAQAWANANRTGGTPYRGFIATPGYQFQLDQGNASINALAGARGGLNSGRTLEDLAKFNQGLASQEYGNYLARLGGLSASGQSAAAGIANAAQNAAGGVSNALSGIGNAQSAGAIGAGNAITGGINNALAVWQYQKNLQNTGQNTSGIGWGPWGLG